MASKGALVTSLIESCGEPALLPEDIRRLAALVVCANAEGKTHEEQVADARNLMEALGLLPGQDQLITELQSAMR